MYVPGTMRGSHVTGDDEQGEKSACVLMGHIASNFKRILQMKKSGAYGSV